MPEQSPAEPVPSTDRFVENAEKVVTTVLGLTRWATRTSTHLARMLPGATVVENELQQLERAALAELRRRLDSIDPLADPNAEPVAETERARATQPPPKQTEPLRAAMAELLMRSIEQTKQRAREYLYLTVLRQLVPDEARILAALADGTVFPLVHVDHRTGVSGSHRVLANASTVGRTSGVSALPAVPQYVARLLQLGLVQVGGTDPALSVQYDICLTDDTVRSAEDAARALGRVRIVRESLQISPFGRELWDACRPREEPLVDGRVGPDVADAPVPAPDVVAAAVEAPALGTSFPVPVEEAPRNGSRNGVSPPRQHS